MNGKHKYLVKLTRIVEQYVWVYVDGDDIRDAMSEAEMLMDGSYGFNWKDAKIAPEITISELKRADA